MSSNRLRCTACKHQFMRHVMLVADNPFDDTDEIHGCPNCFAAEHIELLCEVNGCERPASCGTPVVGGYAQTCGEHMPTEGRDRGEKP